MILTGEHTSVIYKNNKGNNMCDIIDSIKLKSITGYKVAIVKDDRYYSPATGCEYKPGKVPRLRVQKRLALYFVDGLFEGSLFQQKLYGHTAIYKDLNEAIKLYHKITDWRVLKGEACIIKMKLSGSLLRGDYSGDQIFAGDYIESVKPVNMKKI